MKQYQVILADPPWEYTCWTPKGTGRSAGQHYSVVPTNRLSGFDVAAVADYPAALFLWVPPPHFPQAFELATAWGFSRYSTRAFLWAKRLKSDMERREKMAQALVKAGPCYPCIRKAIDEAVSDWWHFGLGHTTRGNPEDVWLFWRDNPSGGTSATAPVADRSVSSLIVSPVREHSRKPEKVNDEISKLYPDAAKLELFATRKWQGWDVWGKAVKCDVELPVKDGWTLGVKGVPVPPGYVEDEDGNLIEEEVL